MMDFVSRESYDLGDFSWREENCRFLVTRELHKVLSTFSTSFHFEEEEYEYNIAQNLFEFCLDHYGLPIFTEMIEAYAKTHPVP